MRRIGTRMAALFIATLLAGCSLFGPHMEDIYVKCSEPGAEAVINGNKYTLPATVSVKRNKPVRIEIYKKGFEPEVRTIQYGLSATGGLDLVGGVFCLFPWVGLISPGAWSLDQTEVYVQLFPAQK